MLFDTRALIRSIVRWLNRVAGRIYLRKGILPKVNLEVVSLDSIASQEPPRGGIRVLSEPDGRQDLTSAVSHDWS